MWVVSKDDVKVVLKDVSPVVWRAVMLVDVMADWTVGLRGNLSAVVMVWMLVESMAVGSGACWAELLAA